MSLSEHLMKLLIFILRVVDCVVHLWLFVSLASLEKCAHYHARSVNVLFFFIK